MPESRHPLARTDRALRLVEHTLIDICDTLNADTLAVDGSEVIFRRRPRGTSAAIVWRGRLGDWLVPEGAYAWRIVADGDQLTPADVLADLHPAH